MQGTDTDLVERALRDGEPLPGTGGFAGQLADGRAVRDVLGRYPLFTERDAPGTASADPSDLDRPVRLPAGTVRSGDGDRRVWSLPEPPTFDHDRRAVAAVREAVTGSVAAVAGEDVAVAFSGGVDSAAVAAGLPDAPLYVAGFPDSPDIAAAREAARLCDREEDLTVVELDHAAVRDLSATVARATGRTNAMDVAIAVPLVAVARRARGDGYQRLAVGQGADELFGGYDKVARAPGDPRVDADTVRGATRELLAGLPDQLERDVLALRAAGVEPVAPLLHDRVVRAALRLPGDLLVDERGERKVAFRRAARESVPDRVAFRGKRAAQYGSRAARELDRLAREAGFERSGGDHVAQFVADLAGDVPAIACPARSE
ncbi:asparagine synthase C-terminal domain-containing protein [Haloglomus litoreum]|uniref:asparagine synthase C-terminal domain-containing protein n=1 Tax=Haloglomus litoreum TaxID=3034026 RepID=UPI0023E75EC4|nr:asparagine synthase-related protein [Haloglomus sp. DT116]